VSLRNIKPAQIKAHTAAQLIVLGYPREQVAADFSETEQALLDDFIAAMRYHMRPGNKPPALALSTTGWLHRRIQLGITTENSSQLREYLRVKHQLDPDVTVIAPRPVPVPEVQGWKFRTFLKKLMALLV
jgi:hypothetical protein